MQIVRYAGHGSVLLQALLAVELGFRLPLGVGRCGEVAVRIVGIGLNGLLDQRNVVYVSIVGQKITGNA